jgi:hypothetical protein
VEDLILTFRPPKGYFDPGDEMEGDLPKKFMIRSLYCLRAVISKWHSKGGNNARYRSIEKNSHFRYYHFEGALMAKFVDGDVKL